MKQVFNSGGEIVVEKVPAPICGDNEVLVRNAHSLISVGTETMSLQGGNGIVGIASKAVSNPEFVHKALDMVKKEGLRKTVTVIKGQPDESRKYYEIC